MWDPGRLLAVRQRTGAALLRPAYPGVCRRPRLRGGPGLRPREPDRAAGRALARSPGAGRGQLGGHDRRPPRRRRGRATAARPRPPQTGAAAGPRADSGAPGPAAEVARLAFALADIRTWQPGRPVDVFTCNAVLQWVPGSPQPADQLGGLAGPGRLAGLPAARQLRPAQPHHPARPGRARPGGGRCWHGVQLNRQAMDPAVYLDVLAAGGLRGGRLGDHVPARAARGECRARLVPGQRAAPGAGRAHPGRTGRVPRRVRRPAPRGLPGRAVRHRAAVPAHLRGRAGRCQAAAGRPAAGRGRLTPGAAWPPRPRSAAWPPAGTGRSRPG